MAERGDARRTGQQYPKDDIRYQPTKAELEEDVSIDATPEELAAAVFGKRPRQVSRAIN